MKFVNPFKYFSEFVATNLYFLRPSYIVLYKSNFGRNYGWYIEYNSEVIGELIDCEWYDMFWDTYKFVPTNDTTLQLLKQYQLWNKFCFRNKKYKNHVLQTAFIGEHDEFLALNKIIVRALYLHKLSYKEIFRMRTT